MYKKGGMCHAWQNAYPLSNNNKKSFPQAQVVLKKMKWEEQMDSGTRSAFESEWLLCFWIQNEQVSICVVWIEILQKG